MEVSVQFVLMGIAVLAGLVHSHNYNALPVRGPFYLLRSQYRVCSPNQVCGEVLRIPKRKQGVRFIEERHLTNCECPSVLNDDGTESMVHCTVNDTSRFGLFQSRMLEEVSCTPLDVMPECAENQVARAQYHDPLNRPYYAVFCRCPDDSQTMEYLQQYNMRQSTESFYGDLDSLPQPQFVTDVYRCV